MKIASRIGILAFAVVAALVAVPAANAGCATNVLWGQISPDDGGAYHVTIFPAGADVSLGGVVSANYWQTGAYATAHNDYTASNNPDSWLLPNDGTVAGGPPGSFFINADNQLCQVGCPDVSQTLIIETKGTGSQSGNAFGIVARVDATFADISAYNYNRVGTDLVAKRFPDPLINSQAGGVANVTVGSSAGMFYGAGPQAATSAITSLRIMKKNAATVSDDTRLASAWTYSGTSVAPNGGTATVDVGCAGVPAGNDVLLAIQLGLEDGQVSKYVGAAHPVRCNGNLAEPGARPKSIERTAPSRTNRTR